MDRHYALFALLPFRLFALAIKQMSADVFACGQSLGFELAH
jgi:hypothetical protein